jgi:hypothetical protein
VPVPHPSRSLLPLRVIRAPPCALGRRAPAPRAACAPAASPLRRSGTGHPALDFRWKIGEGNDGFEGVEDANRRHGFGLGLGGGTATGCRRAGKGGISAILPRSAARWWPQRGRGAAGAVAPCPHSHTTTTCARCWDDAAAHGVSGYGPVVRPERATRTRPVRRSGRAVSTPTRPGLQRACQSKRHHPRPRWNGVATARGALQMVRAGGQRRSLAWRCPVLPFHEPMLVRRPALRRHRHFPAAKAGTTKSPLLVIKCAAGIVASPQGRGNRRSVGTPWKASFHRTR